MTAHSSSSPLKMYFAVFFALLVGTGLNRIRCDSRLRPLQRRRRARHRHGQSDSGRSFLHACLACQRKAHQAGRNRSTILPAPVIRTYYVRLRDPAGARTGQSRFEGTQTYIGINLDRALRLGDFALEIDLCVWKINFASGKRLPMRVIPWKSGASAPRKSSPHAASAPVVAFSPTFSAPVLPRRNSPLISHLRDTRAD